MSKYTTDLRHICEELTERYGQPYSEVIPHATALIFDFSYPIWDAQAKTSFERMILKHYYTREIGAETFERFKLFLDDKLNTVMPYLNKLYATQAAQYDPLTNYKLHHTDDGSDSSTTTSSTTGSSSTTQSDNRSTTLNKTTSLNNTTANTNKYSDTPQGNLGGVVDTNYLTNLTQDNGTNNSVGGENGTENGVANSQGTQTIQNTTTNSGSVTYGKEWTEEGYRDKSIGQLMNDFFSSVRDINNMLWNELDPLFMGIW